MKTSILQFIVCLFFVANQTLFSSLNDDLIKAAIDHDNKRVEQLIAEGADVNARDKDGMTPLLHVFYVKPEGWKKILGQVVNNKINWYRANEVSSAPNRLEKSFQSIDGDRNKYIVQIDDEPDQFASKVRLDDTVYSGQPITLEKAQRTCIDLAKILIDAGVDVNVRDAKGNTALIYAVMNQDTDVVDLLLESNADVDAQCNQGFAALMRACQVDNHEIAKKLIDAGADIFLKRRISDQQLESSLTIFKDEFPKEMNALMIACAHLANNDIILMLLDAIDCQKNYNECLNAFYLSSINGHSQAVELFIKRVFDPKTNLDPIIHACEMALYYRFEKLVTFFLALDSEIGKKVDIYLVMHAGEKILDHVINAGIEINGLSELMPDGSNSTPLLAAIASGKFALVKQLINAGADVNTKNNRGITPLSLARKKGHEKIVKLLLDHGAQEPTFLDSITYPAIGVVGVVASSIAIKKLYGWITRCYKNVKAWREQREREERKQRRNKKIRPEDGMPGPHGVIGSHGSVVSEVTLQSERELDERRSREAEADRARREAATKALDDKRKKQAEENKAWLTLIDQINDAKEADKRQEAGRLAQRLHEKIKSATSLSKSLKLKIMGRVRDLFSKEIISEATKIEIENRLEVIEIIED